MKDSHLFSCRSADKSEKSSACVEILRQAFTFHALRRNRETSQHASLPLSGDADPELIIQTGFGCRKRRSSQFEASLLPVCLDRASPLALICVLGGGGGGGFPPSSHACRRGGGALLPLQVQCSNYLLFTGLSALRLSRGQSIIKHKGGNETGPISISLNGSGFISLR